jgi:hypothetical protein
MKHINHRKKFITFVRRTYTYTCDVCTKTLRISKEPNALLHTPQVHCHSLSLSLTLPFALRHSDTHIHSLQIFPLQIFTLQLNYLCTILFTFTDNCLFNGSCAQMGHILLLYIFHLQIVSMECMMSTKSSIRVLLSAGHQWSRLSVAGEFFFLSFLKTYGYIFHSAVQNSLYQYAR